MKYKAKHSTLAKIWGRTGENAVFPVTPSTAGPACCARHTRYNPLVLAAMEQLVALATSHADCCLPAAVQRPAASAPRCIVSVTLRREGIGARTPQSPPLWAMCVHAAAHMHMTPRPLTLFRATLSITDTTRRGDAGVATLRGVASHLRDQLHPEAGATLAHAAILERLRGCAAQAEPRNGDAEAAAAVMCARDELACRECHKHAGDPARIGLPLILTALDQQRKRPRVEVNAESIDRLDQATGWSSRSRAELRPSL